MSACSFGDKPWKLSPEEKEGFKYTMKTHADSLGNTIVTVPNGCGMTSMINFLYAEAIAKGEKVIVFDPKADFLEAKKNMATPKKPLKNRGPAVRKKKGDR